MQKKLILWGWKIVRKIDGGREEKWGIIVVEGERKGAWIDRFSDIDSSIIDLISFALNGALPSVDFQAIGKLERKSLDINRKIKKEKKGKEKGGKMEGNRNGSGCNSPSVCMNGFSI